MFRPRGWYSSLYDTITTSLFTSTTVSTADIDSTSGDSGSNYENYSVTSEDFVDTVADDLTVYVYSTTVSADVAIVGPNVASEFYDPSSIATDTDFNRYGSSSSQSVGNIDNSEETSERVYYDSALYPSLNNSFVDFTDGDSTPSGDTDIVYYQQPVEKSISLDGDVIIPQLNQTDVATELPPIQTSISVSASGSAEVLVERLSTVSAGSSAADYSGEGAKTSKSPVEYSYRSGSMNNVYIDDLGLLVTVPKSSAAPVSVPLPPVSAADFATNGWGQSSFAPVYISSSTPSQPFSPRSAAEGTGSAVAAVLLATLIFSVAGFKFYKRCRRRQDAAVPEPDEIRMADLSHHSGDYEEVS